MTVTANCTDQEADAESGKSGCITPTVSQEVTTPTEITLIVKDNAGNTTVCNPIIPKFHMVEIRGQSAFDNTVKKVLGITNSIRKNVIIMTRNSTPLQQLAGTTNINFTLNSRKVAYYKGDVDLGNLIVQGSKTLIIEDGDLNIKGNITYQDGYSVFGIIIIKNEDETKGNVYIYPNVTDIYAVLFTEGNVMSVDSLGNPDITGRDAQLANQLYWKGCMISDNTVGGYDSSPKKCPKKYKGRKVKGGSGGSG